MRIPVISFALLLALVGVPANGNYLRYLSLNDTVGGNTTYANATDVNATDANTTQAPSTAPPTPTNPPTTASPTTEPPLAEANYPVPPNDLCPNAITLPITGGDPVTAGTTLGATESSLDFPDCGGTVRGQGVWYKIQVPTSLMMRVSTCNAGTDYDSKISIFTGSCNGPLVCVEGNDDGYPECEHHKYASRAQWTAEAGVTYYILVHGPNGRKGNFEIALEGHNDQCPYAYNIDVGETVDGDTTKTHATLGEILEICGYTEDDYYSSGWQNEYWGEYDRMPRGMWYKVTGTGGALQATTCKTDGSPTPYLAHRIHVYGGNCNTCVGGIDLARSCVTYQWNTSPGVEYYIVVHKVYSGYDENNPNNEPEPAQQSPFELTVTEVNTVSINRKGGPFG